MKPTKDVLAFQKTRERRPPRPGDGDKVLWIRFGAFGDVLQAAAAARLFKKKHPGVHLTFLTRPEYAGILRVQPYIDNLLLWDTRKRIGDFFKTVRETRQMSFDWLFSLHRDGLAALVSLFSRARWRCGYNRHLQFCYDAVHWEYLDALGVDFKNRDEAAILTTREDRKKARSILSELPEKKLFAVIGASKPQKFWPVRHWIEFLASLAMEGWGIVLNGHGEPEARAAEEIGDTLKGREVPESSVLNLVGRLPFPLMAAVAQKCRAAVGNDTGPLHLAALTGTPTLGFFGVTDAYAMDYRMPWFREVKVTCPKAGCHNYNCPADCLADITPEKALQAFREFTSLDLLFDEGVFEN
ncbi:MAG: glycosyltransferase family 9 protein [Synergistaceae bacterium]|nr:glycosyltransferase family 9 protein [Synergistaceae bacterium]